MRITEQMVEQFLGSARVVARDSGNVDTEVRDGLTAVAPLIAEAAVAGYIEQGHEVRHAKSLLRAVMTAHGDGDVLLFAQIREFLDPESSL